MEYTRIDELPQTFQRVTAGWEAVFVSAGMHLLGALIIIELAWAAITLALRRAPAEEWFSQLVYQIMFAGLFTWFLLNSQNLAASIIDSFRDAGGLATGLGTHLRPSNFMAIGGNIATKLVGTTSAFSAGFDAYISIALTALVVVLCFAWITAIYVIAIIEMYFVVAAAPLFLGFGGTRWTKEIAISMARYVISVGAKLLVLTLLAGVLRDVSTDWLNTFDAGQTRSADVMAGVALCMAVLTYSIPNMVQSLVNGSSLSGGSALTAAASTFVGAAGFAGGALGAAAGAAGRAVTSGVGVAAGVREASKLAGAAGVDSTAERVALTFANYGKAAVSSKADQLAGRVSSRASMPWATAAHLRDTRRVQEVERGAPTARGSDDENSVSS